MRQWRLWAEIVLTTISAAMAIDIIRDTVKAKTDLGLGMGFVVEILVLAAKVALVFCLVWATLEVLGNGLESTKWDSTAEKLKSEDADSPLTGSWYSQPPSKAAECRRGVASKNKKAKRKAEGISGHTVVYRGGQKRIRRTLEPVPSVFKRKNASDFPNVIKRIKLCSFFSSR
ncbi:hypothetical protein BSKO_12835 [Bryopsis sp. KO-2023]|nr:hypothetical protein BSKO_12835 [Bryopsis sp. KO-2023]